MRGGFSGAAAALVLGSLVLSSLAGLARDGVGPPPSGTSAPPEGHAAVSVGEMETGSAVAGTPVVPSVSSTFDQRVRATAQALAVAGVPARDIRLPYVGAPARLVDGAVVPGDAAVPTNVSPTYSTAPAPAGIAYYGENDTSGRVAATTVDASGLVGTLTVDRMDALYLDADTPDMWGIQLNAVLVNVTLRGITGYEFWAQNTVDVFEHNQTINLGDDTWNFSGPAANISAGSSTILAHSPNGSASGGIYVGAGPWIHAPLPFTLTLYLNSSTTRTGDQELWYNYSVVAAGGVHQAGNYDWVVFHSQPSGSGVAIAPFEADGSEVGLVGLPNDFEFDFGLGGYNGANMDVLAANLSATLDYCPAAIASCTPREDRPVPAAENFGGDTGETDAGLSFTYNGTTAYASAGPLILRGLWGFSAAHGAAAGSTVVRNAVTLSGSPDPSPGVPYVFVFFMTNSAFDGQFAWAPDAPVWHLAPGTYDYEVMLADYAEQVGTLVVGATPVNLTVDLAYDPWAGVYTPLWAFTDRELAGISVSGNGTVENQYRPFNNPTFDCTACGVAENANLSDAFFSMNDYLFPTFAGVLFNGTDAYVDLDAPVSFSVFAFHWGLPLGSMPAVTFDLQIELVSTEHVTLADDAFIGGWPAMTETETFAGLVNATENLFPQASVMVWNSSNDLIAENDFVSTPTVPAPEPVCLGVCPAVSCAGCVSPDGLLLYGGSRNTVWGNTFRDPLKVPGEGNVSAGFAGLAEAESGDLIFNNNFSVENPTVLLPFDIYSDACPASYAAACGPTGEPVYADTWNVTPQASSHVAVTVNGVPLSGSVLGPTCPIQGGNYWDDYGDVANPLGELPFVNRYNYSEVVGVLPAKSSAIEASIRSGGDDAPLLRASCPVAAADPLRFHATGLPAGAAWSVTLAGGALVAATGAWANFTVPPGPITFTVSPPVNFGVARVSGPHSPTLGSASVDRPTTLTVRFGPLERVTFAEVLAAGWPGLPANSRWTVTVTPAGHGGPPTQTTSTNGTTVEFSLPAGATFTFAVGAPPGEAEKGGRGSFTVPSQSLVKSVSFRPKP